MTASSVAVIYDPGTGLPVMIVCPDSDKELDDPAYNPKGLTQARIPVDVYKSQDVIALAKFVPAECVNHLVATQQIEVQVSPDIAAFATMFAQYKDQLLALSDDQRLPLRAARSSMDTLDVADTLVLLRDAGNIVLTPDDAALADTKAGDKILAMALDVAAQVEAAPAEDKAAVAAEQADAAFIAIAQAKADAAAAAQVDVDAPAGEVVQP